MFLLSTIQMAAFFGEFLVQVKHILLEAYPTLEERIARSSGLHGRFILIDTILLQLQVHSMLAFIHCLIIFLQAIIGDGIVIWRTWTVWSKRTRFIVVPSALLVLSCREDASSIV